MSVENQWHVRLPNGNVITVSLDDLDAAFQRGDVTEETLVFRQGMKEWLPLGQAAGLDDEEDTSQDAPAHVAHSQVGPQPFVPVSAPSSMSPVAVPVSQYSMPQVDSVRPVAFETPGSFGAVGLNDFDDAPFKTNNKKKVIFGAIAVAAAIGLGVLGLSAVKGADPSAAESNVAPKVAAAAAPPPAVTSIPEASPQGQNRLSDEQRKALMSFDDKQKAEAAKKAADRAAKMPKPRAGGKHTKEKDVFVKSGNKYDPLNGAL
jgi:hypothetical protein